MYGQRRVGKDRVQVEADTRVSSECGATTRPGEDHREREKDRGHQGEEIPAPSSGPVALRVWPDIRRVRIGVRQVTGWRSGVLVNSVIRPCSLLTFMVGKPPPGVERQPPPRHTVNARAPFLTDRPLAMLILVDVDCARDG